MTEKDCRRILQVGDRATLDDVKRAYRRLAFALHPDLNPDRPDAARRFQQLNEAYVLLTRVLGEAPDSNGARATYEAAKDRFAGFGGRQGRAGGGERAGARDAGGRDGGKAAPGGAGRAKGPASDAKDAPSGGAWRKASDHAAGQSTTGQSTTGQSTGRTADDQRHGQAETGAGAGEADRGSAQGDERKARRAREAYAEREDVLQDILRDPFARRVFEDIYSQIRREGGATGLRRPPKKRKLSLEWGEKRLALDFTHGVMGALRGWLRRQIDEEQTIYLPVGSLLPGARVRLQIRQGLSEEVRTVEMTLPPDFVVGRPLRLKGLGKRIGPWKGDLYLRLLAKV